MLVACNKQYIFIADLITFSPIKWRFTALLLNYELWEDELKCQFNMIICFEITDFTASKTIAFAFIIFS